MDIKSARKALEATIDNARGQAYKAVHVAEILHHARTEPGGLSLDRHESYRSASKRWRDRICERLIGAKSRSNGAWQDSLFTEGGTPETLTILGAENRRLDGAVEAHVYRRLGATFAEIGDVLTACESQSPATFSLASFLARCRASAALKRMIERIFEVAAWAVIDTVVEAVDIEVVVRMRGLAGNPSVPDELFRANVLGLAARASAVTAPAGVHRLGMCNAGDGRLDLVGNFDFRSQVKHAALTARLATQIARETPIAGTTIVCRDLDRSFQRGVSDPASAIRGVVTEADLVRWSDQLVAGEFGEHAGRALLSRLVKGLRREFPAVSGDALATFMRERGYDRMPAWSV